MKIIILAFALLLAGCANMQQAPQMTTVAACGAYYVALESAVQLRSQNKLTPAQIAKITAIDNQVTPICHAPTPDAAQAQAVITAMTQLQGVTK